MRQRGGAERAKTVRMFFWKRGVLAAAIFYQAVQSMSPVKNCGHRPVQRRRLMEKYRLLQKFGHPNRRRPERIFPAAPSPEHGLQCRNLKRFPIGFM
jgi:hypothetical protein